MTMTQVPPVEAANSRAGVAPAVVLYDGQCALCRRSIRLLRQLDWLHHLHCQDCRDLQHLPSCAVPLDSVRMLEQMHLVTPDRQRVHTGFAAIRWLAWRLPITCWIAPLLYLPGVLQLGNKVYLWVARNRYDLVPCSEGTCSRPHSHDH